MRFPDWVVPMAATLTEERFTGPEWIFERKYDGIRLLAFRKGQTVRLYSRNQLPQDYPAVADAVRALAVDEVILDGEVDWGDRNVRYHVFDVLWLDGRDLMPLPLLERRAVLRDLGLSAPAHAVPEVTGARPWERACREGWEGVIAKRRDSPYEHRRSPHWLKMKCEASQELVIGGFTDPQGARQGLGALLLGYFEGKDFVFAGKVGTGFDTKQLLALRARLSPLEIPSTPFTKGSGFPRVRTHWVRPEVVAQVAFTEWTVHGKLRHGRFLGLREDKTAREVVRETR
jgi:ATP-dependent DNA ligase